MKRKHIDYDRGVVDVPLPDIVDWQATKGYCKVCGCPPQMMPMINRGTGWCSGKHRKELESAQQQEEA